MKQFLSTIVLVVMVALTANAQTADSPFGVKLLFGLQTYNGDLGSGIMDYTISDNTYGVGLAYYINQYLDASIELKWMKLNKAYSLNGDIFEKRGASFAAQNLNLNFLVRLKPIQTRLNPYIALGVGVNFMKDVSHVRKNPHFNALSIPFGVGVNYKLIDHVMVNVQWLYNRTFTDGIDSYPLNENDAIPGEKPRPNLDGKGHDDFTTLSVGVTFTFGGGRKEPPAAKSLPSSTRGNMKVAGSTSQKDAQTSRPVHQLNDQTLTALKKLKNAAGQKPEQARALKAELIRIDNRIQLAFNQSNSLKPAQKELKSFVAILQVYSGLSVDISAYIDKKDTNNYNKKEFTRRAQLLKDYLVNHGVKASRIAVVAPGETELLKMKTVSETHSQNRSVQLTLHYK